MAEESNGALLVVRVCQEDVLADVQGHFWFKFHFRVSFIFQSSDMSCVLC